MCLESPRVIAPPGDRALTEMKVQNGEVCLCIESARVDVECRQECLAPTPSSGDAVSVFEKFREQNFKDRKALDGREAEYLAKGPAHVLRQAGTLAFMAWAMKGGPEPERIDAEFVTGAVRLWSEYWWPHARAVLRLIGLTDRHSKARRVLQWIRANRKPDAQISVMDMRRSALSDRVDEEQTKTLMAMLQRAGWVRLIATTPSRKGGRPVIRWHVHPKLFTSTSETSETSETYINGGADK
jgi:hypothetical protein